MKYLYIIAEGIPDYFSKKFDNKTPLELARTPNMDQLARLGSSGVCKPIPSSFYPGSDIGFISLIGNNPAKVRGSRGFFEAKGLGINITPDETPFRVNLITIQNGLMVTYGCPTITNDECIAFAEALNKTFEGLPVKFYPVSGYRLLLIVKNDWLFGGKKNNLKTFNPREDIIFNLKNNYPKGNGSEKIIQIMEKAQESMPSHDINQVKIDLGESPANGLWIWANELPYKIKLFSDQFSIPGFCVPSSHLIRGIAVANGLDSAPVMEPHGEGIKVYAKRVEAAISAFKIYDLVIMHFETINDISKKGDLLKKCQSIESFDEKVVGKMLEFLKTNEPFRILITSGHALGIDSKIPTRTPVPFVLYGSGVKSDKCMIFSEKEALAARFISIKGHKLLKKTLLRK